MSIYVQLSIVCIQIEGKLQILSPGWKNGPLMLYASGYLQYNFAGMYRTFTNLPSHCTQILM